VAADPDMAPILSHAGVVSIRSISVPSDFPSALGFDSLPTRNGDSHLTVYAETLENMKSQGRIFERESLKRRIRVVTTALCAVAALAGLNGCQLYNSLTGTGGTTSSTPGFTTTVVIGDSLSAGFQNDSLLDSQQPNGWASLVAKQANFSLALPLIASPGVPAVLELTSLGPPPVIQQASGISIGRSDPLTQPYDLAVPGHMLNDVINTAPVLVPTSDEELITDLVLGFPLGDTKSQMNEAIALNPTAIFIWAGNDDALQADESGMPSSMTPVATFTQEITQLLITLHSQTKATLIVGNIPDVTAIPYLTPAATVIATVAADTGLSQAQVAADLGIANGDLVNATGEGEVETAINQIKQGQTPAPLTDSGFLSASEIAQVQSTIDAYNSAISAEVTAVGGILVDIHSYFQTLQSGITINKYNATPAFLGGIFSLDGVHPTNTGCALIANQYIAALNSSANTNITQVNVSTVAAADPLFGLNVTPGEAVGIPLVAARRTDALIKGCKDGCR
jgi:phospholipase/lecithinase/hemolysin